MPPLEIIASRRVSEQLQEQFAVLSGDRNPMHMDPVAARRTQAGLPVVHGVHTLLWALESLVASGRIHSPLIRVKVKFLRWVYIEDEAELALANDEGCDPKSLLVQVHGLPVLAADLLYGDPVAIQSEVVLQPSPAAPLSRALDLSFAELDDRCGDIFTALAEDSSALFPKLAALISGGAVAEIAACSYIVGMEAPGLHSMFSKLDLTIGRVTQPASARTALNYRVTSHDERFRKARIAVLGQFIAGTLDVFIRVPPVAQASMAAAAALVNPSEFAGMRALIIGGSRGLGEITAKLIAAGGGIPTITYALGKAEAESVVDQIMVGGGQATTMAYDVRKAPLPQFEAISSLPTHLFYFATNTIFKPKKGVLSGPMLAEFVQFYVQGFYDLCTALTDLRAAQKATGSKLIVFYPSTVFIDERPAGMTEYAMIKAAGEQLCADMNIYLPDLEVVAYRLPKLPTDQTAGVIPERSTDAAEAILPLVRRVYSLSTVAD